MDEIPARLEEVRAAGALGWLVVYCHHGVRSKVVADWLIGQGIDSATNLRGGIDAWSVTVDPGVARY